MAKPSLYKQLAAVQVDRRNPYMKPSPRHWNCGLLKYKGRLWMCYRYHLSAEHGSRCATGIVSLDPATFQPTAPTQHLNLPATHGDEHFEDARLFMFKGQPHLAYTQMTGYRPGVDYNCHMRYARLKLTGNRWLIEEVWQPKYGNNSGMGKEKNWAFFEHDGKLFAVYQDSPNHRVIQLEGDRVVAEHETEAATWPWGHIRGGSPPIPWGKDQMLAIFHSSVPTEDAPHYVRYYGAAYTFEAKPPFRITAISSKPIMAGSEADGHGYDPRYSQGWKPYVVFPCGLVPQDEGWLVSLGVNDWQCAIGRLTPAMLNLVQPDRADAPVRYFYTPNGTLPARMIGPDNQARYIAWELGGGDGRGSAPHGVLVTNDGREAETLAEMPRVEEITEARYLALGGRHVTHQPVRMMV